MHDRNFHLETSRRTKNMFENYIDDNIYPNRVEYFTRKNTIMNLLFHAVAPLVCSIIKENE